MKLYGKRCNRNAPSPRVRQVGHKIYKTRTENKKGRDNYLQLSLPFLERATRIELATSAWEADVLPLNYARNRTLIYYPTKRAKSQVVSIDL